MICSARGVHQVVYLCAFLPAKPLYRKLLTSRQAKAVAYKERRVGGSWEVYLVMVRCSMFVAGYSPVMLQVHFMN